MRDEREAALAGEVARLRRELDAEKAASQARGVAERGFPLVVPGFRRDSFARSLTSRRAPSAAPTGQAGQDGGRQDGNDCAGGMSWTDTAFLCDLRGCHGTIMCYKRWRIQQRQYL